MTSSALHTCLWEGCPGLYTPMPRHLLFNPPPPPFSLSFLSTGLPVPSSGHDPRPRRPRAPGRHRRRPCRRRAAPLTRERGMWQPPRRRDLGRDPTGEAPVSLPTVPPPPRRPSPCHSGRQGGLDDDTPSSPHQILQPPSPARSTALILGRRRTGAPVGGPGHPAGGRVKDVCHAGQGRSWPEPLRRGGLPRRRRGRRE